MVQQPIDNSLDRLIRGSFYALIFFLPISIALVSTFSAFAIFFFLVKRILMVSRGGQFTARSIIEILRPPPTCLNWPLAAFMAAVMLSVLFSQYHGLSVRGLAKILRGIFLYISFIEAFNAAGIRKFIIVGCTSAFVTALSGLSQYFHGIDFVRFTPLTSGRVASSLRHANDFGAYIVSVCPLFLTLVLHWNFLQKEMADHKSRINSGILCLFFLATCAVLIWCLGLTFSRSSWLAFFITLIWIGLYRKKALALLIILITGFLMAFSPLMVRDRNATMLADDLNVKPAPMLSMVQTPAQSGQNTGSAAPLPAKQMCAVEGAKNLWCMADAKVRDVLSNLGTGRWLFWTEAWHIICNYPLWGAGLNTYSKMGQKYKIDWGGYPHNSYLQMTAEIGVLGLGTFLFLLGVWFKNCVVQLRRRQPGYVRCLLLGVTAAVMGHLIQSFFDTTFYSVQLSVLFWLLLALGVAVQRLPPSRN